MWLRSEQQDYELSDNDDFEMQSRKVERRKTSKSHPK